MSHKESILDRIDAVTDIGEHRIRMGMIQPAPKSVKIEITARCNLRCKFCAVRTRKEQPKDDMDFEFFKKITEDMRICGVEEIGLFFLGESFMAPNLLIECTRWVKKELEFPWVFLTTNGVMAKPEHVERVMEAGLDSLKWSLNYDNAESFREITGGSEKQYENVIQNVQESWVIRNRYDYNTIISASSIRYDAEMGERMKEFIAKNIAGYVDEHYWLPLYQMAMYREKVEREMGYTPTAGNMGRLDNDTFMPTRLPLPCWTAFTEGHVRVDGALSACCFGSDDKFDMGQLDGKNFMWCWNSPKFRSLRKAQLETIEDGPPALIGTPCAVCVAYE